MGICVDNPIAVANRVKGKYETKVWPHTQCSRSFRTYGLRKMPGQVSDMEVQI